MPLSRLNETEGWWCFHWPHCPAPSADGGLCLPSLWYLTAVSSHRAHKQNYRPRLDTDKKREQHPASWRDAHMHMLENDAKFQCLWKDLFHMQEVNDEQTTSVFERWQYQRVCRLVWSKTSNYDQNKQWELQLWGVLLWLHLQKRFKTQLSEGDKQLEPRMNPRRTCSDQIPAGQNTEKLFGWMLLSWNVDFFELSWEQEVDEPALNSMGVF